MIIGFSTLNHRMPPNLKIYDGSTDLDDHVTRFMGATNQGEWQMPVWCRMLQQTLDGPARGWFDRLPNGCMDNLTDLQEKFAKKICAEEEMLNKLYTGCTRGNENINIHEQLKSKEAYKSTKLPRGEFPEKGQGTSYQGNQPPRTGNRRYDNRRQEVNHLGLDALTKRPMEILATELQLQLPTCPPMIGTPKNENLDRYYDYHGEKGHCTNDRYQLKRQLESTLESGNLSHLIKVVRQRGGTRGRQPGNNNDEYPITFPPALADDVSNEPLVIEAKIEGPLGPNLDRASGFLWRATDSNGEGGIRSNIRKRRSLSKNDDEVYSSNSIIPIQYHLRAHLNERAQGHLIHRSCYDKVSYPEGNCYSGRPNNLSF
ncbi:hypothetical protein Tco_0606539 [Tanacetum coccineum]